MWSMPLRSGRAGTMPEAIAACDELAAEGISVELLDPRTLFPFDTVETSADYDFIRLGTSGPYLLPVEAEVLSCVRGTSICSRNKIEFRNYRKFGAQSDITFDKP